MDGQRFTPKKRKTCGAQSHHLSSFFVVQFLLKLVQARSSLGSVIDDNFYYNSVATSITIIQRDIVVLLYSSIALEITHAIG